MIVPTPKRATRYLSVILRWLLIMGTTLGLTLLAGLYLINNVFHKIYSATAQIQAQTTSDVTHNAPGSTVRFQAELDFMQSPDFLLAVIKDLGLDQKWADQDDPADSDQLPDVDALTHLSRMLRLQRENGTNLIDIIVSGEDPNECAAIANAVADRYQAMRDTEVDQRVPGDEDSLREQLAEQEKVVADKRAALEKMRQELAQFGITEQSGTISPVSQEKNAQVTVELRRFREIEHEFELQETILDDLTIRLHQVSPDLKSPIRIISRAVPPTEPITPNRNFDLIVTVVVAAVVSVTTASFVEMVFLFVRAGERAEN